MLAPPLLHLLLVNLSQIIDVRDLARHRAFDHLNAPPNRRAFTDCIRDRDSFDADHANARVVLTAVVHPVAQVAQPRLQRGAVVFGDGGPVGHDVGDAGDGCPAAVGREERDVYVRVGLKVGSFAGFRVGVEEEVDAAGFLWGKKGDVLVSWN